MRAIAFILALFAVTIPVAAEACRVSIPISQRLDSWYENGLIDTVFVGEIVTTQMLTDYAGATDQWAHRIRVLEVHRGDPVPDPYVIGDEILISSCGWENNLRGQVGDKGAFYLTSDDDGNRSIFVALRLEEAMRVDPRIRAMAEDGQSDANDLIVIYHPRTKPPEFDPVPTPDLSNPDD